MSILRGDWGVHKIDRDFVDVVRSHVVDNPQVILEIAGDEPREKTISCRPKEKYTPEYAIQLLEENADKHDDIVAYAMLVDKIYNPDLVCDVYNLEQFHDEEKKNYWKEAYDKKTEKLRHCVCRSCGIVKKKITKCGGCGCTFYCSSKCQKLDWNAGHKKICKQLKKGYTSLTHRY